MKIGRIEKGITPPLRLRGKYSDRLEKMEIGDSFMIRLDAEDNYYQITNVISAAVSRYGRLNKKRFSYRTVLDEQGKGIRIWRVER